MKKIRFGILSTANIARKNWKSIHDSGNSIVSAVASRDIKRSRQFIEELQAEAPFETPPAALGSYEELLASKSVDAVYIPLPTGLRKEWVLRAAVAGKHVLCEKPCGLNASDVQEMIAACKKNRVQFMDGVMFMHNPRLSRVREIFDDGKSVGQIKRITSSFSFCMAENVYEKNVRLNSQLEPAGCLGDLGWYCIRFTLWAMNWRLPREVTGRILFQSGSARSPAQVPMDFSAELIFDEKTSASFYCSFIAEAQNWVHVSGSIGQLRIDDFVHPLNDHESAFELNRKEIRVKCCDCGAKHSDSREMAQQANMIRNFSNQVRSGQLNDEWLESALKTQRVMDVCLEAARTGTCLKLGA
ncbi:MAG: Gfo/Idh/MocA family oxidoreductase [Verrucomicrobiota bacterium]|jgi:predicted dehydrogenase